MTKKNPVFLFFPFFKISLLFKKGEKKRAKSTVECFTTRRHLHDQKTYFKITSLIRKEMWLKHWKSVFNSLI